LPNCPINSPGGDHTIQTTGRITSNRQFYDAGFPSIEPLDARQTALVREFNAKIESGDIPLEHVPCLCGAEEFSRIADFDRYRIKQTTVICNACGLIQSMPRMTAEATRWFYGSDYYRLLYDPEILHLDRDTFDGVIARSAYRYEHIKEQVGTASIDKVLEVGCGGGWNLYPFFKEGKTVVGYDFGPALIRFGRSLGLDLRVGSAAEIEGEEFDLIILSHIVEHFLDPVGEVRKITDHLSASGVLYIEVPNADQFCLGGLQNAHTYFFSPRTLAHYMGRAGLAPRMMARFGPHIGGIFERSEAAASHDLGSEFAAMRDIVRAHERREAAKGLLKSIGIFSLAKSAISLIRRVR